MNDTEVDYLEINCHEDVVWSAVAELLKNNAVQFHDTNESIIRNPGIESKLQTLTALYNNIQAIDKHISTLTDEFIQDDLDTTTDFQNHEPIINQFQLISDTYTQSINEYTSLHKNYKKIEIELKILNFIINSTDARPDNSSTDLSPQQDRSVYLESLLSNSNAKHIICGIIEEEKFRKFQSNVKQISAGKMEFKNSKYNKFKIYSIRTDENIRNSLKTVCNEWSILTMCFDDIETVAESIFNKNQKLNSISERMEESKQRSINLIHTNLENYKKYRNLIKKLYKICSIISTSNYDQEKNRYTIYCWSLPKDFINIRKILEKSNRTDKIIYMDACNPTKKNYTNAPSHFEENKFFKTDKKFHINPNYFIPFHFALFGIIMGDFGFGLLALIYSLFLKLTSKFENKHFVIPIFSMYGGLIYNQFFGIPINFFPKSKFYPFGLKPSIYDMPKSFSKISLPRFAIMFMILAFNQIYAIHCKLVKLNKKISTITEYINFVFFCISFLFIPLLVTVKIFIFSITKKSDILIHIAYIFVYKDSSVFDMIYISIWYFSLFMYLFVFPVFKLVPFCHNAIEFLWTLFGSLSTLLVPVCSLLLPFLALLTNIVLTFLLNLSWNFYLRTFAFTFFFFCFCILLLIVFRGVYFLANLVAYIPPYAMFYDDHEFTHYQPSSFENEIQDL